MSGAVLIIAMHADPARCLLHETSTTSDHDVLHIWERLELGSSSKDWSSLPDGGVLEEVWSLSICYRSVSDLVPSSSWLYRAM